MIIHSSLLDASLINSAAPPGSMRYFSLLYTPVEKRDTVLALYVIDAEIRMSAHSASHDVAHTRLQWWRAEIDRLINHCPQHPATQVLNASAGHGSFDTLHELLAGADMDLAHMTYATARELRAYAVRSGGAVAELIAAQLSDAGPNANVRSTASRLGSAIRHAEMLRDVRQDVQDGRLYLPLEVLDRHGVSLEDLRARDLAPATRLALQSLAATAKAEFDAALLSAQSSALRPLVVLAALHRRLLDRIAARDHDFIQRIDLGPIEKPWVAWRAARTV